MEDVWFIHCQFCMIWKTLDMISLELSILIKLIKDEDGNGNVQLSNRVEDIKFGQLRVFRRSYIDKADQS